MEEVLPRPRIPKIHRSGGRVMTKQAEAQDSDINHIVSRYVAHGQLPQRTDPPLYGDFSAGLDYHAMLERVRSAESDFYALPAAVRDRCRNDVGVFVDLVNTPEGLDELRELGLDPKAEPGVDPQVVVEDPPPDPPQPPPTE